MANEKKTDTAPVAVAADTAPAGDDIAALKAQLAALAAENLKLTELATRPQISADILAMTGVEGSTRNARPETGAIPLHFTSGLPVFKAERPTGKSG